MGLDVHVDAVKNPRTPNEERIELCYWRKNYDLVRIMRYDLNEGGEITLSKMDVERMLEFLTHNRDYWGGFDTVPSVCELLDKYDDYIDKGMKIAFSAG